MSVTTLYSYPNPFGPRTYAVLKLAGLQCHHEYIFDASEAPRGQFDV